MLKPTSGSLLFVAILLTSIAFCPGCNKVETLPNLPLDELVLQASDLPEGTEQYALQVISPGSPSHPLSTIARVPEDQVVEAYQVFALSPAGPAMNYANRYVSSQQAAVEWENVVSQLQDIPGVSIVWDHRPNAQTFGVMLVSDEETLVYWGAAAKDDVLVLLVVEALNEPGAQQASGELFNSAMRILESRMGINPAIGS